MSLAWATRLKIAIGAAKGLAFLHGAESPVIYRDFKTSNILLDSVYIYYYYLFTFIKLTNIENKNLTFFSISFIRISMLNYQTSD